MISSNRVLGLLVSASLIALCAAPAEAKDATKKEAKSYKITGGLQVGYSTDRHAGVAPVGESMAADSFDDDDEDEDGEDEDESDSGEMEFGDADVFEDLDLEDQDLLDQLDETTDEDGDGNFFDDDADFVPGDDPTADDEFTDLNGDGVDDDAAAVDPVDPVADPDPVDPLAISTGPVTTAAAAVGEIQS